MSNLKIEYDADGNPILDSINTQNNSIANNINNLNNLQQQVIDTFNVYTKKYANEDYVNNLFNIILNKITTDVLARIGNNNSLEYLGKHEIAEIINFILTNNNVTISAYYFYENLTEEQEAFLRFYKKSKLLKNFNLIPFIQKKYKLLDINDSLYIRLDNNTKEFLQKLFKKHTFTVNSNSKLFIDNLKLALSQLALNINSINNSVSLSNAKVIGIDGFRENTRSTDSEKQEIKNNIQIAIDEIIKGNNSILMIDSKDVIKDFNSNLSDTTKILELQSKLINYLISFNSFLPISYFTGEFSSGQGNNNEGEKRAIEDGLKIFYESYLQEFFFNLDPDIQYKPNFAEILKDNISTVAIIENSTLLDKRKILENLGLPMNENAKNNLLDKEVVADTNNEDLFIDNNSNSNSNSNKNNIIQQINNTDNTDNTDE